MYFKTSHQENSLMNSIKNIRKTSGQSCTLKERKYMNHLLNVFHAILQGKDSFSKINSAGIFITPTGKEINLDPHSHDAQRLTCSGSLT